MLRPRSVGMCFYARMSPETILIDCCSRGARQTWLGIAINNVRLVGLKVLAASDDDPFGLYELQVCLR